MRDLTDKARSALRDIIGLIPQHMREQAGEDLATVERALTMLAQFRNTASTVEAHTVEALRMFKTYGKVSQ